MLMLNGFLFFGRRCKAVQVVAAHQVPCPCLPLLQKLKRIHSLVCKHDGSARGVQNQLLARRRFGQCLAPKTGEIRQVIDICGWPTSAHRHHGQSPVQFIQSRFRGIPVGLFATSKNRQRKHQAKEKGFHHSEFGLGPTNRFAPRPAASGSWPTSILQAVFHRCCNTL
jgi:hypothetical protein